MNSSVADVIRSGVCDFGGGTSVVVIVRRVMVFFSFVVACLRFLRPLLFPRRLCRRSFLFADSAAPVTNW